MSLQARLPAILALAIALGLAGFGTMRGTRAVGGSDSSCYGLMAEAFGTGHWQPTSALAVEAPWPDASRTLAPGGFIPSPVRPGASSPICAPGFSVLMAPFYAVGGRDAIFAVTPIAAFVLVWCAFVLANRLAGGLAGVAAAALTASSPIVLFQTVQPMNDVATAALWLGALVLMARPVACGALIGLAILVRPNLAPLAVVVQNGVPAKLERGRAPDQGQPDMQVWAAATTRSLKDHLKADGAEFVGIVGVVGL